ncbi:MAG TPA: hypothetical protein VK400_01165 [Pyrinomonadaceae bacterium]|nr:hypothetical protein [Pyrinomonadaceae bacterium]
MKRSLFVLTFASYLALSLTLLDFGVPKKIGATLAPDELVVHEWGTFTSIAGKNGAAIDWRPLNGASDLPKFVYTGAGEDGYRRTYDSKFEASRKGNVVAKVRMETPVIYFYTAREREVSVRVDFPRGQITEWYPQASVVNGFFAKDRTAGDAPRGINWGTIKLLPDEKPDYPREASDSHYYPARETDAVPVQVCNADKTRIEKEKFLFYRGVGDFALPLNVRLSDGKIALINKGGAGAVKTAVVFENRGGKIGFRFIESIGEQAIVERPETSQTLDRVLTELEKILVAEGLYAKEARAMIKTWRDSWFEEGLRVFYVLPTEATDEILPLRIEPKPKEIVRVLVGRAEIITPEMEEQARKQVGLLKSASAAEREEAQRNLQKHGRFYEPILKSLLESEQDSEVRKQIQELISLS